jgi:arylsulfatase A-like enzyme
VAGLLAPIAALALFAKLGSLLGPARGASLAKILVRLFIPACLLLIPASVRIARGFSPPRAERDGDPELSSLLLLSVDTLRADGIGCLGNPSTRTPSLDRLSRTSRVQIECIAPSPWTLPSLASVLTGTYPGEHHVLEEISGIAPSVATIAEICAANGRRTAAFVSNPWLATGNFARGFDVFDVAERLDCFHDASCSRLVQTLTKTVLRLARLDSAEAISARALAWLRGGSGSFFLWLHYFDPHLPNWPARPYDRLFGPPPRFARSSLRFEEIREGRFPGDAAGRAEIERLYYGEVAYTDRAIGRVLRSLEEDGTLRKTSVVFCADHGEEFWDHDDYGHGHSMFEEVVRVPLFARIPDSRSGELDAGLAGLVDVAPTATALLGIENVETRAFSGESLLTHEPVSPEDIRAASISSSATTGVARRAFLYGEGMLYGAEQKLLRGEKWKLVLETPQEKAPPRLRLYDLQSDPSERTDLVMARADVADSLLVELEHWMARVGSAGTAAVREGVGLDPSIRALLQSLGYIAD